jgi:hypothetical protein
MPIGPSAIVTVKLEFIVTVERRVFVVHRRVLDGLTIKRHGNVGAGPAHVLNPFWRDQHFMPNPPIAGIYDQVPNGPCEVIHQKPLDVTDLTVARLDMISLDCIAAAQVRIRVVRRWRSQVTLVLAAA